MLTTLSYSCADEEAGHSHKTVFWSKPDFVKVMESFQLPKRFTQMIGKCHCLFAEFPPQTSGRQNGRYGRNIFPSMEYSFQPDPSRVHLQYHVSPRAVMVCGRILGPRGKHDIRIHALHGGSRTGIHIGHQTSPRRNATPRNASHAVADSDRGLGDEWHSHRRRRTHRNHPGYRKPNEARPARDQPCGRAESVPPIHRTAIEPSQHLSFFDRE